MQYWLPASNVEDLDQSHQLLFLGSDPPRYTVRDIYVITDLI